MLEVLAFVRSEIRASELWLVVIAAGVGAAAGLAQLGLSTRDAVASLIDAGTLVTDVRMESL